VITARRANRHAIGLPVIAGPAGMRALIRSTQPLRCYSPADDAAWAAAAARI
jgi:hypothetical protein